MSPRSLSFTPYFKLLHYINIAVSNAKQYFTQPFTRSVIDDLRLSLATSISHPLFQTLSINSVILNANLLFYTIYRRQPNPCPIIVSHLEYQLYVLNIDLIRF